MSPVRPTRSAPEHWRSLDELADSPEFHKMMEREFPSLLPDVVDPASRRTFLKLMGASVALAGMTACRWPEETILPFAKRPEGRTPGVPQQFATAMDLCGVARGLLVTSYDGRPVKIDGNPQHPAGGASDPVTQASILELYDPDRSRSPWTREGGDARPATWAEFDAFARAHFASLRDAGGRFAVLAEASSSPTLVELRRRMMQAFPGARWVEYEAVSRDNERRGAAMAWGTPMRAHYDLSRADVVVCLDADLLSQHPDALRLARQFADRRRSADEGSMNRMFAVEGSLSITGALADERFAVRPSAIAAAAVRLAAQVAGGASGRPEWLDALATRVAGQTATPFVGAIAAELIAHRGRGLVVAGPRQPAEVHALAHFINDALGNVGNTVSLTEERDAARPGHAEAIATLGRAMSSERIETLVMIGGNPVYDAPADVEFGEALQSVKHTIHLSLYRNETSERCSWHLNRAHYLEAWGDGRAWDGTVSVAQPLIEPLFGGRSAIELVGQIVDGAPVRGYDIVRESSSAYLPAGEAAWQRALYEGFVAGSADPPVARGLNAQGLATKLGVFEPEVESDGLELVFLPDPKLCDGRFANNGWLHELPEPITQLAWDNALLVSQATAAKNGLRTGYMAAVEVGGKALELPVFVMPGQADDALAVWLGYGRTAAGRVGNGVGFDAYRLRTTGETDIARRVLVRATDDEYRLASTQDHFAIDAVGLAETNRRRPILVREASLEKYRKDPHFVDHVIHVPPPHQLWEEHKYDEGYQWAMSIDLNTCIGCAACVVACQAENNIPIVGKQEVINGREMHWMRVDRYFKGDPAAPEVAFQPVTCQHCENAPCEQVCPVGATMHNAEGLNQMVYNRCVGTRYCSNNCPFKVRRFNFWNNQKDTTPLEAMAHNPEVTVRSRGVMEKCTYCVQRIESARARAKLENRSIRDGEVVAACEQACPTQAIVFGNRNDPESRVARVQKHNRSYGLLEELKVAPRTRYLAKIRNPVDAEDGEHHGAAEGQEHA